jgi:tetratricopeptide (TPR) repeat protein
MKENNKKIKEEIENSINNAFEVYAVETPDECLAILINAWNIIPDAKEEWDEAYLLSKYITSVYFNINDLDNALQWLKNYKTCDEKQRNYGESEFMAGKIYYELDEKNKAKEYFKIADKKSRSRCWEGEDVKYFQLFKKK